MSTPAKKRRFSLNVEYLTGDAETFRALMLASLGFSAKYIADETGLTVGQVGNRCRKAGIRVKDYRDCRSEIAKQMEQSVGDAAGKYATKRVKENLE